MTDLAEECNRLNAELSELQSQHTNLQHEYDKLKADWHQVVTELFPHIPVIISCGKTDYSLAVEQSKQHTNLVKAIQDIKKIIEEERSAEFELSVRGVMARIEGRIQNLLERTKA